MNDRDEPDGKSDEDLRALAKNMKIQIRARLFKTNGIVSLRFVKFQTVISEIRLYFLLKKCEKLSFFQQKMSVYLLIKSQNT